MAEVEDREKGQQHHHHHRHNISSMSNFPRDLLNRFMAVNNHHHQNMASVEQHDHADAVAVAEEEEIELSLGLSMNGRFGVDPTAKKIKRTASIPELVNPVRDEEIGYVVPVACNPLMRTCSLPTETEEEWRKRKELQTLRRMEARRKRTEKQRNLKAIRERNRSLSDEIGSEVNNNNLVESGAGGLNEVTTLGRTVSLTTRVSGLGLNGDKEKGNGLLQPSSPPQGSIGSSSQGTGSSGNSESEGQQGQGPTPMDSRSPIGTNLLPDELKSAFTGNNAAAVTMRNQPNKPENRTKDIVSNLLEDMPSVSTKGEGPNGKKIEGFLYKYGKGEEVRILCVCHGSFLTPAEFVKHAGGADVTNPLKHIVVSPSLL